MTCPHVWCLGWGNAHDGPHEVDDVPPAETPEDETYDRERGYVAREGWGAVSGTENGDYGTASDALRERIENPLVVLATGDGDEELCDAMEQAQGDAATLWRALEAACRDGWADGPGAMRHYIEAATRG